MPQEDVQHLELDPSPNSDTPDVAAEAAAAPSSEAQDVAEDSTLSIVREVVEERKAEQQASSADGTEEGKTPNAEAPKEPDNEDFSDVPFGKHPRFRELLAERKLLKADAERYQNVQNFLDSNGISAEEAADGFIIMGLIKSDPAAAWQKMKPIVQQVLIAAGEVLPDDLTERVRRGELTQDGAFEISRSRATVNTVKASQSFAAQREQRSAVQALSQSLYDTAAQWEADRKAKDPNFEAKYPLVMKELKAIQYDEGKPDTPEGVRAQLKKAYDSVVLPTAAAPATPTRPRPTANSNSGQFSRTALPKPESTLDIIRAARSQR